MKLSFNLLLVGPASTSLVPRLKELMPLAEKLAIPVRTLGAIESDSADDLTSRVVFIAGSPTASVLAETVNRLDSLGVTPIILVDALAIDASIHKTLSSLAENRFQCGLVAQVSGLVKNSRLMLYAYAKSDTTATILVVINAGTSEASVLTIKRDNPPFKGYISFPGGFLDHHLESLPGCGSREGSEETSVDVPEDELTLVDVRSEPSRDNRGHVVDHGYMWLVPPHKTAAVLASVRAGDDAEAGSAGFTPVRDLLKAGRMAFDHYDLLLAALRTGRLLPPERLTLRLLRRVSGFVERLARRLEQGDPVYNHLHR